MTIALAALMLSACGGGDESAAEYAGDYPADYEDLQAQVEELEAERDTLQEERDSFETALGEANSQIENAQISAGESYEEMNETLEGLETQEP